MRLNQTTPNWDRDNRNGINENWDKIERLSNEVNDLVLESGGDSNLEVVQARGGKRVLNERLNEIEDDLSDKADKGALSLIAESKRDKDVEIGMADLDQEVREAFTGGAVPVVGEDSVGNINLRSDAVTRDKMANNYAINYPYLSDDSFDLNYVWDQGNYIVSGSVKNNPFETGCTLGVERFKTLETVNRLWVVQEATSYGSGGLLGESKKRLLIVDEVSKEIFEKTDWGPSSFIGMKITNDLLDENYALNFPYLSDDKFDLDYIWDQGNYIVNARVKNNPYSLGSTLKVDRFKTFRHNNFTWIVQEMTVYSTGRYRGRTARRILYVNENEGVVNYKSAWTDSADEPIKILTIGNSFGLDVTKYIHRICESLDINVQVGCLYISGGLLRDHDNNIKNNENVYQFHRRYYVDDSITSDFLSDYSVDDALGLMDWDYVFFNQASAQSGVYSSFQPYLTDIIEYVKGKQPNAKIVLMPTWAYASDFDDTRFDKYNRDQMTMYDDIINAYKDAMADVDFDVIIPAGTAIQNARTDDYLNSLDRELTRDGYHLSNTGCYIAGLTLFQVLINKENKRMGLNYVPEGVSKKAAYLGTIAAENAVINPFRIVEIN